LSSFVIGGDENPADLDPETQMAMEDARKKWADMMKKNQLDKIEARIAKLTAELNLTPGPAGRAAETP